ncbi:MAG: hypothetical protein L6R40_000376 [Gallowayella cf. fulva]|nr:MAG: hypothetical protein L6R40_000376 [Xanthomendoza cf. fulva]
MSGSFEKSVKGGTKIKLAAPKAKYVEHILVATHAGEAGVAEIFRAMQNRLRDSTWTIVFKALIIVHLMIREGEANVTLKYLADSPSKLAISNFSEVQAQGTNIRHYYSYVLTRAKAFRDTKIDWVREGQGRLKKQTVDKGLLRETEAVQSQINALLKCDLLSNDPENEITLTAFRLLTMDLLILFGIMNEGTINVLEHYFEMSKYDAERAFKIYKTFSKQTDQVVQFLSTARQYENATRLEIPKLKHAPTSLTSSLEEYLNDPDFEINRRQYLAQQEAKKSGKPVTKTPAKSAAGTQKHVPSKDFPEPTPVAAPQRQQAKGPAPDLIDFFDSIEQKQQPMATQPQQTSSFQNGPQYSQQPQSSTFFPSPQGPFVQNGQAQQPQQQQIPGNFNANSNPYGQFQDPSQPPVQPDFTGTGLGGLPQQQQQPLSQPQNRFNPIYENVSSQGFPIQQQQQQLPFNTSQPSQQSSNPFRQSSMPTGSSTSTFTPSPAVSSPLTRQGTNPFARNVPTVSASQSQNTPFTSPPPQQTPQAFPQQTFQQQPPQAMQPHRTGTNPFARNLSPPTSQTSTAPPPLLPSVTGSTNPFRQSTFINQQTGQGWQSNQATMGGLEQLETVPVFPRPGQSQYPQQQQQQQQQSPWS